MKQRVGPVERHINELVVDDQLEEKYYLLASRMIADERRIVEKIMLEVNADIDSDLEWSENDEWTAYVRAVSKDGSYNGEG